MRSSPDARGPIAPRRVTGRHWVPLGTRRSGRPQRRQTRPPGEVSVMAHGDSSAAQTIEATQRSLEERLGAACSRTATRIGRVTTIGTSTRSPRRRAGTLAAIEAVLVEPARHAVPDGEEFGREYVKVARRLERAPVALIKDGCTARRTPSISSGTSCGRRRARSWTSTTGSSRRMVDLGSSSTATGGARRSWRQRRVRGGDPWSDTAAPEDTAHRHPWPRSAPDLGAGRPVLGRRGGPRDPRSRASRAAPARQPDLAVPRRRSEVRP